MKNPNFLTIITLALALSLSSLLAVAIVTRYPGVIGMSFQAGPTSGHVFIDGRNSNSQRKLPEAN